jgi:hypothetical protein
MVSLTSTCPRQTNPPFELNKDGIKYSRLGHHRLIHTGLADYIIGTKETTRRLLMI